MVFCIWLVKTNCVFVGLILLTKAGYTNQVVLVSSRKIYFLIIAQDRNEEIYERLSIQFFAAIS